MLYDFRNMGRRTGKKEKEAGQNSNDVLLAIPGWASVHPLLKVIPVEWDHSIPYGLLHSTHPSETVKRFLAAVQEAIQ